MSNVESFIDRLESIVRRHLSFGTRTINLNRLFNLLMICWQTFGKRLKVFWELFKKNKKKILWKEFKIKFKTIKNYLKLITKFSILRKCLVFVIVWLSIIELTTKQIKRHETFLFEETLKSEGNKLFDNAFCISNEWCWIVSIATIIWFRFLKHSAIQPTVPWRKLIANFILMNCQQ